MCVMLRECRVVVCGSFFFFKQKTAYEMRISDGSSDVCSSDLNHGRNPAPCQTPAISRDCQRRHYKQHSDEQHQGGNDTRHKRPSVRSHFPKCPDDSEIGSASCRERVCQYV